MYYGNGLSFDVPLAHAKQLPVSRLQSTAGCKSDLCNCCYSKCLLSKPLSF